MSKKLVHRHGDVDLFAASSVPKGAKKRKGTTIALGEATGHHHTLHKLDINTQINIMDYVQDLINQTFVEIQGGKAVLKHQEHAPLVIEPGVYEVKIEHGIDPWTKEYTRVID